MLFPEKITLIQAGDRVLEIGPGALPHSRSNAFLELNFDNNSDRVSQRGGIAGSPDLGGRPVHYYEGQRFPFTDRQFDYVICSHVIEHVIDPQFFLNEIFRVGGGRGYLEYPLITYDYLYDFEVHLQLVKFDFERRVFQYFPKQDTALHQFTSVSSFFRKSLENGWDDLCAANRRLFFEGFEFSRPFEVEQASDLQALQPDSSLIVRKGKIRRLAGRIMNKLRL